MSAVVELEQVQQHYGKLQVLHDVSWQLQPGEIMGLFGHNGAGKTTTVRLILGLIRHSSGVLNVLGGQAQDPRTRQQIGFLPENVMFYPQLTGLETLQHFARLKGASMSQVTQLLEQVGLTAASTQRVKAYSKGMRQRLGLAQALLGQPKLLILDEPTVGLDPIATQSLYRLMEELRSEGTSIIICSHVLPGVESYIDKAVVMARGKVEVAGDLYALRAHAGLPVRIRVKGLAGTTLQHAGLESRSPLPDGWEELAVKPEDRLEIVGQLLQQQPHDLEVRPPSLEDLYCHFTEKAGAVGVAGVQ